MTAPSWASPYGADPASYGLSPVTVVKYDGRRFRVCPPTRPGGLWTWGECGGSETYSARSMRLALFCIGALCGIERRGGTFHYTREG